TSCCRRGHSHIQEFEQPLGAFGEDLVRMPVYALHDHCYRFNIFNGYGLLEKIAHTVYKNSAGTGPTQRFQEFLGNEPDIKPVLIGVARHSPEAFRERLGITMF